MYFFQVNVGEDCPVFDGLFEFCQLSTGGSVGKETASVPGAVLDYCSSEMIICLLDEALECGLWPLRVVLWVSTLDL